MPWSMSQPEPAPEPSPAPTAAASKKKWIIAGVVLALLLIVVLIVVLCLIFLLPEDVDNEIGEQLKKNMNLSADPCNDFFNYACGGWNEAYKNSENGASTFSIMQETVLNRTMGLLEAPVKDGEPIYKTKLKKLFAACTNEARRKERGTAPFMTFLKKIGPFPIIESSFDSEKIVIQNLLTKLTSLESNPLFYVDNRVLDNQYVIHIASSPEHLLTPNMNMTKQALGRLGIKTDSDVMEFQIQAMFLIRANLSKSFQSSSMDGENLTILQLQNKYNWRYFNWLKFIQDVTGNASYNSESKVHVTHPELLVEVTTDYFTKEYSRSFVNFLMKNLLNFVEFLDPSFSSPEEETGSEKIKFFNCARGYMSRLAISCMYVDEFYTNDYDQKIADIMGQLKEVYRKNVNKTNLPAGERINLTSSVDKIQEKVGLIESMKDNKHITYLNTFFEKITSEEFFEMNIEMTEHYIPFIFKLMQGHLAISEEEMIFWRSSSLSSFISYINTTRYIAVPAASLQPPVINLKWPSSMNFGAIGSLLSRETLSALIELSKSSWLSHAGAEAYIEDCILSSPSGHLHSELDNLRSLINDYFKNPDKMDQIGPLLAFFQEHLSDGWDSFQLFLEIQGVQASFMAYQNFRKSHGEESTIKGLDLNHNQLFFLGYTQTMCQYIKLRFDNHIFVIDHDKSTLISLYSSKDFSEAFSCKPDAPMNKIAKCDFFVKS